MEIDSLHADESAQAAVEQPFDSEHVPPPTEERRENVTKQKKQPAPLEREAGKSLLPLARVQKIMKADKVRRYLIFL